MTNLARDPAYADVLRELATRMRQRIDFCRVALARYTLFAYLGQYELADLLTLPLGFFAALW